MWKLLEMFYLKFKNTGSWVEAISWSQDGISFAFAGFIIIKTRKNFILFFLSSI